MIHSDDELQLWWKRLSRAEQSDLLATMIDKMSNPDFAISLSERYESGEEFSAKQLAAIRKWHRD